MAGSARQCPQRDEGGKEGGEEGVEGPQELVAEPWVNLHRALLPTSTDPASLMNQFADQAPDSTLLAFISQSCKLQGAP